ncbi:hypothetical protein B0T21DRAFT_347342 [Apiosordaria backusii]|uniref:Uncharacterized protein n=1 Tax=Apiosordaria backusii TaxID=314023 RepID=A0AA40BME2_9PEZI|nr:hypothetical protein B0T21DRAFT_347342 [Apiosordaria backusii]
MADQNDNREHAPTVSPGATPASVPASVPSPTQPRTPPSSQAPPSQTTPPPAPKKAAKAPFPFNRFSRPKFRLSDLFRRSRAPAPAQTAAPATSEPIPVPHAWRRRAEEHVVPSEGAEARVRRQDDSVGFTQEDIAHELEALNRAYPPGKDKPLKEK